MVEGLCVRVRVCVCVCVCVRECGWLGVVTGVHVWVCTIIIKTYWYK